MGNAPHSRLVAWLALGLAGCSVPSTPNGPPAPVGVATGFRSIAQASGQAPDGSTLAPQEVAWVASYLGPGAVPAPWWAWPALPASQVPAVVRRSGALAFEQARQALVPPTGTLPPVATATMRIVASPQLTRAGATPAYGAAYTFLGDAPDPVLVALVIRADGRLLERSYLALD